ncbi:tetratricopeptide repeat protein [Chryseobacterium polytrichastri]|uniref:Tetratricopeptide repeat-containing protein n=1 Tax=Chryseobacterium polytrichastri TaxID=1302687 RepID=A0A1M6Z2F6_9FLAO|nr:hypothetical protein [Chryseobacterium polytrichastri]SHL24678.1 Tetratricopeptide repeat-containing protein [Chryseobacterium polytrichastri]
MKLVLKIFTLIFLVCLISINGQKIPDDSLMKTARLQLYDNPEKAISIGRNLLKKEKDINKSIAIYLLLSTANIAKRNFDESLQYILKAKELAQKTNDLKTQTNVLISAAIQYQQMELFSKSLEVLNEADILLGKLPDNASGKIFETARSYAIRGMIYKSQSNSEIALEKFLISIKNFNKIETQKNTAANMSIVYYNIGYCYMNLNQLEKAQPTFLESIRYAQKDNAKSLEAFALKGLAEMQKQKHENKAALSLLIQAENLSKNTGDLVLNEGIYKEMSENYLVMGKPQLYQTYNKKYFEMRFKREQNELISINHSINNHNEETSIKIGKIKDHYHYLMISSWLLFFIISGGILYLIIKVKKENRRIHKKNKNLFYS